MLWDKGEDSCIPGRFVSFSGTKRDRQAIRRRIESRLTEDKHRRYGH